MPKLSIHPSLNAVACGAIAAALLGGCALSVVPQASDGQPAAGRRTVEGRINYVVDGQIMTPYGAFRPAWPAPFVSALHLQTGSVHATPSVADGDGSFRWQLEPGAYVITRIGFGTLSDDTYIAWPRVVLCVPPGGAAPAYAGHLRLEGMRYDEERRLSSGTVTRSRGVRYTMRVVDERPPSTGASPPLMQVRAELPVGDSLHDAWRADRTGLIARACPAA